MNRSIYSADSASHVKIVVLGLLCATIVASVGICARVSEGRAQIAKATQPISRQAPMINECLYLARLLSLGRRYPTLSARSGSSRRLL
jgi:hypothetical protein